MPSPVFVRIIASFLLLTACQSQSAALQPQTIPVSRLATPTLHPATQAQIDQVIQTAMQKQGLVGLALGLVENGKITALKGYGWADQEQQQAVTTDSSFRWASISKTITAVLSLQLVEHGRLDLDRNIQEIWPAYRNAQGWPVSQRQLLGHLAGVGSYDDVPGWREGLQKYQARSLPPELQGADMVLASADVFAFAPLMSAPGSAYRYSTFGSMLAGAVLAKAGSAPYLQQFEQRIRAPLGLRSLQADYQAQTIPNRVSGYYREQNQLKKRPDSDVAWKLAGGGFTSNIGDLTRYMQALINQELVQPTSYREMWSAQQTTAGKPTGYGLSFAISQQGQEREVGHFGAQENTRTVISFLPDSKRGVALMCNSEWANLAPIRDALLDLLKKNAAALATAS